MSELVDSGAAGDPSNQVLEAYRTGKRTFMGVDMLVAPGALVPRAETELLGETAKRLLESISPGSDVSLRVIDMCCGSGNLACALTTHDSRLRMYAADLTDGCVDLT